MAIYFICIRNRNAQRMARDHRAETASHWWERWALLAVHLLSAAPHMHIDFGRDDFWHELGGYTWWWLCIEYDTVWSPLIFICGQNIQRQLIYVMRPGPRQKYSRKKNFISMNTKIICLRTKEWGVLMCKDVMPHILSYKHTPTPTQTDTDIIDEDLFWQIHHIFVPRGTIHSSAQFVRLRLRRSEFLWKLMSNHLYLFCSWMVTGIGATLQSQTDERQMRSGPHSRVLWFVFTFFFRLPFEWFAKS